MIATEHDTPRAWVGCLACYNAGHLVGEWIDATEADTACDIDYALRRDRAHPATPDLAESMTRIRRAHLAEGHEEWWVFDHEGFAGLLSGECSPAEAQRSARLFDAIGADGHPVEAVAAWAEHTGPVEEWDRPTRESFEDAYAGEWRSEQEYAEQLAEDVGAVTGEEAWPLSCIDWSRAARDLFIDDVYAVRSPGGIYVFRSA